MKRVLSLLVIFLLIFTYSMPAYADEEESEDSEEISIELKPIFEGWVDNGDGTYKAYFGYLNNSTDAYEAPMSVNIPFNTNENKVSGYTGDATFPSDFDPGRTEYFPNALIEIDGWDGSNIVWTLDGRTATASLNAGLEHKSMVEVKPIFEGWVDNGDGTYKAYFGYLNNSTDAYEAPMSVNIPFNTNENKVSGYTGDATFPSDFDPGRTSYFPNALIEIDGWDGSNIVWTLDGRTATASLNAGLEHKSMVEVKPIFEGWVDNGDGTYKAYFGYLNNSTDAYEAPMSVNIPFNTNENKVSGYTGDATFPSDFDPGRTSYFPNALIEIDGWDGSNIVWTLDGRTATASLNAGLEHKSMVEVKPIFEGWVDNGDGTYKAYFGYLNNSTDAYEAPMSVNIPFNTNENKVSGYTGDATFPSDFDPGRTSYFPNALIEIDGWDGSNIVWTLDGRTATASLNAGLEHKSMVEVKPIFEGWVDNGDGTYKAYFGYLNNSTDAYEAPMSVNIPFNTNENKVSGYTGDATFPSDFDPGRTSYFPNALIEIDGWDGSNIVWTLDGRTATAGLAGKEHVYYEVIFDSNEGSTVPSQSILEGKTIEEPSDPTRSGYTFTGWTYEAEPFDFEWPVVGEMTLVASWSSNPTGGGGGGTTGGGGGGTDATIEAVRDNLSTDKNTSIDVETSVLMTNDIDADDFVSVQNPINGSVSLSGTTVTFIPAEDFVGTAYFYYTVENGGDSDNGLVVVAVTEVGTVEINPENTPLGGGNPNELMVIEPEITPLGVIDFSMPYIMGYPDTTFRPDREVTRAEMAAIFARILGLDLSNPGEPMYKDVSSKDWYYKYIQSVTKAGLFIGYGDNTFKPNRPVTHAEIASAFSKYWELRGIEVASEGDYYSDVSGHWAEEMINRLYNAGISVSYADGTFKPNTFTTRTELVVFVNRSLNRPEEFKDIPSFKDVLESYWGYGAIEAANGYREPESASLTE